MSQKILIIDDDVDILNFLSKVLESRSHKVKTGMSYHDAISQFKAENFDIVLLDINLAGESGISALKEIKSYRPGAVVIMLTASSQSLQVFECQEFGAFDYIYKPLGDLADLDEILSRAIEHINRWRAIRKHSQYK